MLIYCKPETIVSTHFPRIFGIDISPTTMVHHGDEEKTYFKDPPQTSPPSPLHPKLQFASGSFRLFEFRSVPHQHSRAYSRPAYAAPAQKERHTSMVMSFDAVCIFVIVSQQIQERSREQVGKMKQNRSTSA